MSDWLDPMAPLIFTPQARRLLALALLQPDDERIGAAEDDVNRMTILGLLEQLGLLELAPKGYVATDFLRGQVWATELRRQPFPD